MQCNMPGGKMSNDTLVSILKFLALFNYSTDTSMLIMVC